MQQATSNGSGARRGTRGGLRTGNTGCDRPAALPAIRRLPMSLDDAHVVAAQFGEAAQGGFPGAEEADRAWGRGPGCPAAVTLHRGAILRRPECAEMVRRYAHLSSENFAQYVERFSPLRVGATIWLRSAVAKAGGAS